jgi:hypothetical protein
MNISVYIDRLVLDGIDVLYEQRPLLQLAFETELARLLASDGLASGLQASRAVRSVSAGEIQMAAELDPTRLGEQIARSAYGEIGP